MVMNKMCIVRYGSRRARGRSGSGSSFGSSQTSTESTQPTSLAVPTCLSLHATIFLFPCNLAMHSLGHVRRQPCRHNSCISVEVLVNLWSLTQFIRLLPCILTVLYFSRLRVLCSWVDFRPFLFSGNGKGPPTSTFTLHAAQDPTPFLSTVEIRFLMVDMRSSRSSMKSAEYDPASQV